MGHGASPSKTQTIIKFVVYYLNYFVTRDEARATAASSALSKILQGAVKLPNKANQGTDSTTQNNLQATGGNVEEYQVYRNRDVLDVQLSGDVKFDGKGWQEEGISRMGPALGERVVGQGPRGSKGADEVELMTKARGGLFSSSKQGGGGDDGAVGIAVKREGDVGREGLLPHGIQGMEDFGKWSPRWNRREDFGIREVEEFAKGFHNFGI